MLLLHLTLEFHLYFKMPFVCYIAIFMICAGLTLPRSSGKVLSRGVSNIHPEVSSDLPLTFYFVLWAIILFAALTFIMMNGIEYVNWPRLIPLTDAIEYAGPGTRTGRNGRGVPFVRQKKGYSTSNGPSSYGKNEVDHEVKERLD